MRDSAPTNLEFESHGFMTKIITFTKPKEKNNTYPVFYNIKS